MVEEIELWNIIGIVGDVLSFLFIFYGECSYGFELVRDKKRVSSYIKRFVVFLKILGCFYRSYYLRNR